MIIDLRKIQTVWINLDSATKNAELMQNRLREHRFEQTFRKSARQIPAPHGTPDPIKHYVGCAQSHIDILEDINYQCPLLILEDDAEFTENFHPMIEIPDNTDAVYLGTSAGNPHYLTKRVNKYFMRIGKVLATHAILYCNTEYKKAVTDIAKIFAYRLKIPFDNGCALIQERFNVLTPNKPFFVQANERQSANQWEVITSKPLVDKNSDFPMREQNVKLEIQVPA
jgi:hypothetical protein